MKNRIVVITMAFVLFFLTALVALLFFAPAIANWYVAFRTMLPILGDVILCAFYICAVPAGAALLLVFRLLQNIHRGQLFCPMNTRLMTAISWCCMMVALVTAISAVWYLPFCFITVAMLFIFLIVRVVRACWRSAIELKEENSLTI